MWSKEIRLHTQNIVSILSPILNWTWDKGTIQSFDEHKNDHFGNEKRYSYKLQNYEESGYDLNLDLLTTLYQSCV